MVKKKKRGGARKFTGFFLFNDCHRQFLALHNFRPLTN